MYTESKNKKYYVAVLGNNQPDTMIRAAEEISLIGGTFKAVEVYMTPFDAIRGLNEKTKIKPEVYVTVYETSISHEDIAYLQGPHDSHVIATTDLIFTKKQDLVLGAVTKYL